MQRRRQQQHVIIVIIIIVIIAQLASVAGVTRRGAGCDQLIRNGLRRPLVRR